MLVEEGAAADGPARLHVTLVDWGSAACLARPRRRGNPLGVQRPPLAGRPGGGGSADEELGEAHLIAGDHAHAAAERRVRRSY